MKVLDMNQVQEVNGGLVKEVVVLLVVVAVVAYAGYKKGEKDGYESNVNC